MTATRKNPGTERDGIRYRALLEASPDAVLAVDLRGRVTEANPALCRMTGLDAASIVGAEMSSLFEPPSKVARGLEEVLGSGSVRDLVLSVRDGEDGSRVVGLNGSILPGPDDKPAGAVWAIRDLSSLWAAKGQLDEAHKRLREHLENSPVGVVEWDHEVRITGWSAGAERLFGWSAEEAIGKVVGKDLPLIHPDDTREVGEVVDNLLAGQQRAVFENRNCRKDGAVIHCEWHNSVLREEAGRAVSVMSIALDVTRRKQLEEELRRLADLDALTGALNRRAFETLLQAALARRKRLMQDERGTVTLLYLDLDDFKPVNDRYGHSVGDELLQAVTQRLHGCLRKEDILARLGGDEFAVLLEHDAKTPDAGVVRTVATRVLKALHAPFLVGGERVSLSASLGLATADDDDEAADLLHRADGGMYLQKAQRRPNPQSPHDD